MTNKQQMESSMREVFKVRAFKAGYELRTERVSGDEAGGIKPFDMVSAYTPHGDYIGNSKWAYRLCVKRGIKPELASNKHHVCSIGYSEKDGKWYGWSHRAIYGFKIGDMLKKGDCGYEYLPKGFKCKTLKDCKRMAIAFARSVS